MRAKDTTTSTGCTSATLSATNNIQTVNAAGTAATWNASAISSAGVPSGSLPGGVQSGDNACFGVLTGYGFPVGVSLGTAINTGASVSSLRLSSVPNTINTGDLIDVINSSGQSQFFSVTAGPYAVSSSATTVTVTTATASNSYPVSSQALDSPLATQITSGNNVTSVVLKFVAGTILNGDSISVTNSSGQTQTFTATGGPYAASNSQTTISVTSATASNTYGVGSYVYDTTGWTTSWTSTGIYASARVGFAATGVTITSGWSAGKISTNDTVAVTFNQPPTASLSGNACTVSSTLVILGDSTHTNCTGATTTDTASFGKLSLAGATMSPTSGSNTASVSVAGNVATLKITNNGTGVTVTGTPTWTFTPSTTTANLKATTGGLAACTTNSNSNSLCLPTTTTNF